LYFSPRWFIPIIEPINKKFGIAQIIEASNCFDAIGGNVTLSFQAKVSSLTKLDNVKCAIVAWSGTADTVTSDIISAWGVEGTNPTLIANATYENTPANLSVTTSFASYSVTANVDTASTKNIILFIWSDVTDTTLGDFLYITNIQLEKGSTATSFDYRSIGQETLLCQRYFQKTDTYTGVGASAQLYGFISFPVIMRSSPTIGQTAVLEISDGVTNDWTQSATGISINSSRVSVYGVTFTGSNFASVTNYRPYFSKQSTTGLVTLNAEL